MNRLSLGLVLILVALCGCAEPYVMKLSNGSQIVTPSKPTLKNGSYYYKDAHGKVYTIPQTRVLELEPTSMATDENKFTPTKPQKSHWWKFW